MRGPFIRLPCPGCELYLVVACCSKANRELHGDDSDAPLLPVALPVELFHFCPSDVEGRLVQTLVPAPYQGLGAESLFVDGFIHGFVHVFLPNLKQV